jgi:hypothetical protein
MLITFDVPHVLSAGTSNVSPEVREALIVCMKHLRQASTRRGKMPTIRRTGDTRVTFDLPSLFHPGSHPVENAEAVQALLRCLTSINLDFLRKFPDTVPLYRSGVVYDRTEVWDSIPALLARQYGDCKSLSCARVAEYLAADQPAQPVFRWIHNTDPLSPYHVNYHILVLTSHGWEDPSKVCGMLDNENLYFKPTG